MRVSIRLRRTHRVAHSLGGWGTYLAGECRIKGGIVMHTYRIEEMERGGGWEMILGIVVLATLVVCGLATMPTPSRTVGEAGSIGFSQDRLRATVARELRTRDGSLEKELKDLSKTIESTRADLASFRVVHDTLIAQVAASTAKVQEIESRIQETKTQAGKLNEYAALQEQLRKERDEALTQAKDATERIRELTLQLQRAGVYP